MGNRGSSLETAVGNAEKRLGRVSVEGRYHRSPNKLSDDYDVEKKALGTGYSGAVLLAHSKQSKQRFAVKAFKLHGVPKEKKKELVSECEIFLSMDHPHVARLVDVYESDDQLALVMECMEGGELFDRVTARKVFSEKDAAATSFQMLLAVKYIHGWGIVHRDLKLENFLYEKKDSDFLKLIDFGFSKVWDKNTKMELSCGTLSYVAPEVLNKSYTSQCDMWSLGVIVFILLVGHMPFTGASERQQIAAIRSGKYTWREDRWKNISPNGRDFVKKLLVVNADERLTAEQALAHDWITKRASFDEEGKCEAFDKPMVDALCNFAHESQFRRKVMQLMAWSLSAEERGQVRESFLKLDKEHTGSISLVDLKNLLQEQFHVPEEETSLVFQALDGNHDGTIEYSEFLAAMVASRLQLHDDLLQQTFRRFDLHQDGFIRAEEFKQVLGDGPVINNAMEKLDQNCDGKISYEEFIAYLRNGSVDHEEMEAAGDVIDRELQKIEAEGSEGPAADHPVRKRDRIRLLGSRIREAFSGPGVGARPSGGAASGAASGAEA